MKGITPYEYYVPGSLDWLRVVRRIREAKDGGEIPESRRLYLVTKDVIAVMPVRMPLYKDEDGRLFVDREDLATWDEFERYRGLFE
ncbi:hypothetical protein A3L02_07445 [Thermococcus celer Vu 13 = JCM 8558]|uniref:Uncharacterized protein n=2 Tax=Thermococcus celer TaxID=2264 RepID=A0A218P397_THECE|nr:hypothetical protein A3L02_07445 [Thermococcus celer Vu 13 = JCM 8558]